MSSANPRPKLIRRNDRIVFIGDSITEQMLYTNYVETYLAARYPDLKLTFFNAGWSGSVAPEGLARLERDVLPLKPTLVTICFGMNDGRYSPPAEEIRTTFLTAMTGIVKRLRAAGARVLLLTPGFVDGKMNLFMGQMGYNSGGLRVIAHTVIALAKKERLPWFDLHKLMNEVDRLGKKKSASFFLTTDGVHPNPAGHLVMAHGMLTALGVPPRRDIVNVNLDTGRISTSPGVKARMARDGEPGRRSVEIDMGRLPFFVEPAAREVLPFVPFQETFNSLRVRVAGGGGAPRRYFRINQQRIGWVGRGALARGIEIFDNWAIDAMVAAANLLRYTNEKDQVYLKLWRLLALNNAAGPGYNRAVHALGIKGSERLERSRAALVRGADLRARVILDVPKLPGEQIGNGEFIATWSLRGPFEGPRRRDFIGGEKAASAAIPRTADGWQAQMLPLDNLANCLIVVCGQREYCCAYAVTVINSPVEQHCDLLLGTDDGYIVWLNGTMLDDQLDLNRPASPDQNRVPVTLKAGMNILLLKINQTIGGWGFMARFAGLSRAVSAIAMK